MLNPLVCFHCFYVKSMLVLVRKKVIDIPIVVVVFVVIVATAVVTMLSIIC